MQRAYCLFFAFCVHGTVAMPALKFTPSRRKINEISSIRLYKVANFKTDF